MMVAEVHYCPFVNLTVSEDTNSPSPIPTAVNTDIECLDRNEMEPGSMLQESPSPPERPAFGSLVI